MELLAELLANVEWQQFVGVVGIEPRKTLDGLAAQRALRLRTKAKQLQVHIRCRTCRSQSAQQHCYCWPHCKVAAVAVHVRFDLLNLGRVPVGASRAPAKGT